jgi:hypothetical protein
LIAAAVPFYQFGVLNMSILDGDFLISLAHRRALVAAVALSATGHPDITRKQKAAAMREYRQAVYKLGNDVLLYTSIADAEVNKAAVRHVKKAAKAPTPASRKAKTGKTVRSGRKVRA